LRLVVITIITLFFSTCNQDQKFDKASWQQQGDLGIYPNREKMLKDLMNHHQLKGLTYKQLVDLIGEPEKYSDEEPNTATYNIVTDYGRDIDPVYIKNLEVKISSDSIVTDANINEIKH
jgi:hypothetical protein